MIRKLIRWLLLLGGCEAAISIQQLKPPVVRCHYCGIQLKRNRRNAIAIFEPGGISLKEICHRHPNKAGWVDATTGEPVDVPPSPAPIDHVIDIVIADMLYWPGLFWQNIKARLRVYWHVVRHPLRYYRASKGASQ